ncbi:MAG: alpha-hydroxy-acid oxidizing protein [Alphaproteobacteria bacterium]|nr:alpha-hydroxy-acid oxidizing protein [Alphaproteobacteria bacterium]
MRLDLDDWEREALERLDPMAGDYYRSGARSEATLAENRAAFARVRLRHRVLVDVSQRSTATTLLGHRVPFPVVVAPTAFHKLAHPEGEAATARGTPTLFTLSTLSNTAIEEVVPAAGCPVLFQLYVYKDRGACRALVDRVVAAGAKAIVLTADAAILGMRKRDVRNRFRLPPGLAMPNVSGAQLGTAATDSALATWVRDSLDPSLGWRGLEWLAGIAGVPIVLKGVVRGDDARRAVEHGVAAVQVSNHGGRQLDGGIATLDALPDVAEAADGRCEVWLDGGVRSGTDVLKALARGANAVAVGRPALWGLTLGGAEGVSEVLELLRAELDEAMALAGCPDLASIDASLLA